MSRILHQWHKMMGLKIQSPPSWYRDRLREEMAEVEGATTMLERLSERSDVFFAISRAKHDGFPVQELPAFEVSHIPICVYMVGKYTSRWAFYRTTAMLCRAPHPGSVSEVVNPSKDSKLSVVAARHGIEPEQFKRVAKRLMWVWPMLP